MLWKNLLNNLFMKKIFVAFSLGLALLSCQSNQKKQNAEMQNVDSIAFDKNIVELLTDSISMDSTRADLYFYRARNLFSQEQVGAAMIDVNRAISLDNNYVDAYLLLADIYYTLGDETNINATLNKAAEVDPFDARPLIKLAELNLLQQNYNLSVGYVDKALNINKYNPKAYFVKGMLYMARQDTASALSNFMIAREQDANFYDPLRQISIIYVAQKNPIAESFLRSAVNLFPDEPVARYELALYLQDNGNPEEAIAQYDTLLLAQPHNSIVLFNIGYVNFIYLGNNEEALYYFDRALQENPNYLDALFNKGRVMEQIGNYVKAKDIFSEVLRISPNYELAINAMNRIQNQIE
jgi:Tfp pilus assembly protein PilF